MTEVEENLNKKENCFNQLQLSVVQQLMQRMFLQCNLCFQESAKDNKNLRSSLEKLRLSVTQKKTQINNDLFYVKPHTITKLLEDFTNLTWNSHRVTGCWLDRALGIKPKD